MRVSPKWIPALVVAGYTLPTVYLFRVVLARVNGVVAGPFPDGDAFYNVWHLWLSKRALEAGQDPAHTDRIFALVPAKVQIFVEYLYSDWVGWILQSFVDPLGAYNLLIVSSFVLSGCMTYLLARQFVDSRFACFAAGWLYTFSTLHFSRAGGHLGLATVQWLPFCAWTLIRLARQPSVPNAILAGVGMALVPLSDVYYVACFLVPFSLVWLIRMLVRDRRWLLVPRHLGLLALAAMVALLVAGPPLRSYIFMQPEMAAANQDVVEKTRAQLGADLAGYVVPAGGLFSGPGTTRMFARLGGQEKAHYLGLVPIVLAIVGLISTVTWRTGGLFWLAVATVSALFSLGPLITVAGRTVGPSYIYDAVFGLPLLSSFRAPNRTSVLVLLAVSMLAAYGVQALIRAAGRWEAWAALGVQAALLVALADAALWGTPYPSQPVTVPALYQQLAADPDDGIVLNLPLTFQETHQFYQTVHEKRLAYAFVSRITPSMLQSLGKVPELQLFWVTNPSAEQLVGFRKDWRLAPTNTPPSAQFSANLQSNGIRYVLQHQTDDVESQRWMRSFLIGSLGEPFYDGHGDRLTAWCVGPKCPPKSPGPAER